MIIHFGYRECDEYWLFYLTGREFGDIILNK